VTSLSSLSTSRTRTLIVIVGVLSSALLKKVAIATKIHEIIPELVSSWELGRHGGLSELK